MKNIWFIVLAFLVFGAGCFSLEPKIPRFEFILVFEKDSEVAKTILSPDKTIHEEEIYFYVMEEGQKKKINTSSHTMDDFENILYIKSAQKLPYHSSVATYTYKDIYDLIFKKGLTKIYLQKLNDEVDTIEMAVSKEMKYAGKENWYPYYFMDEIKINGETPTPFGGLSALVGYAYYLEPPKSASTATASK